MILTHCPIFEEIVHFERYSISLFMFALSTSDTPLSAMPMILQTDHHNTQCKIAAIQWATTCTQLTYNVALSAFIKCIPYMPFKCKVYMVTTGSTEIEYFLTTAIF